jgi:nitroreductase
VSSTFRTIVSKRDSREYTGDALDAELLRRILTAGRMAGSSKNSQPLRFVVVRGREQAARLAKAGDYTRPLRDAPLSIAILLQQGQRPFDAGRAAQNMMLAAWEAGVTSCPVAIHRESEARTVLGHPEEFAVAMVLCFGHPRPGARLGRGAQRLPLKELVHEERWRRE